MSKPDKTKPSEIDGVSENDIADDADAREFDRQMAVARKIMSENRDMLSKLAKP